MPQVSAVPEQYDANVLRAFRLRQDYHRQDELSYIFYSFQLSIVNACFVADVVNLERLAKSFPEYVKVYKRWYNAEEGGDNWLFGKERLEW